MPWSSRSRRASRMSAWSRTWRNGAPRPPRTANANSPCCTRGSREAEDDAEQLDPRVDTGVQLARPIRGGGHGVSGRASVSGSTRLAGATTPFVLSGGCFPRSSWDLPRAHAGPSSGKSCLPVVRANIVISFSLPSNIRQRAERHLRGFAGCEQTLRPATVSQRQGTACCSAAAQHIVGVIPTAGDRQVDDRVGHCGCQLKPAVASTSSICTRSATRGSVLIK